MTQLSRQLDSRIEIITPENIAFHYTLAGPFRRLPAYLLDCAFRLATIVVLSILAAVGGVLVDGSLGLGAVFIAWFLLSWFYGGLFETLWNGQTPGKRLMGLRVLSVDGQPINAWQAILRNLLRDVDAMPMVGAGVDFGLPLYTLGLTVMAASPRFARLGDLAAGTIVVVEQRTALGELARVDGDEVAARAAELPPNLVVRRSLARALSVYVSRRKLFSPARRYEIALTLADPLARAWNLPAQPDPDLLLSAIYHRAFIGESAEPPIAPAAAALSAEVVEG
jgi:uncharacterized RDD family membrane protein YckC